VERDNDIRQELCLPVPSVDELQLLLNAPPPMSRAWSDEDIAYLLNRSKYERSELDEIKQYHKARYVGCVWIVTLCGNAMLKITCHVFGFKACTFSENLDGK